METIKVNVVDLSDYVDAEGKYLMKVKGEEICDGKSVQKECTLDLSGFNLDQLGVIAGFLNAAFVDGGLDSISAVGFFKVKE